MNFIKPGQTHREMWQDHPYNISNNKNYIEEKLDILK